MIAPPSYPVNHGLVMAVDIGNSLLMPQAVQGSEVEFQYRRQRSGSLQVACLQHQRSLVFFVHILLGAPAHIPIRAKSLFGHPVVLHQYLKRYIHHFCIYLITSN